MNDPGSTPPEKADYLAVSKTRVPEPRDEEKDKFLEIKNPFLANLFHYGMITVLLIIGFIVVGALLFGRSGGSTTFFIVGGLLERFSEVFGDSAL